MSCGQVEVSVAVNFYFIFSFVSNSLTYITIPKNDAKIKINCNKKLTTTYPFFVAYNIVR